jgi:hypothetical protein
LNLAEIVITSPQDSILHERHLLVEGTIIILLDGARKLSSFLHYHHQIGSSLRQAELSLEVILLRIIPVEVLQPIQDCLALLRLQLLRRRQLEEVEELLGRRQEG